MLHIVGSKLFQSVISNCFMGNFSFSLSERFCKGYSGCEVR